MMSSLLRTVGRGDLVGRQGSGGDGYAPTVFAVAADQAFRPKALQPLHRGRYLGFHSLGDALAASPGWIATIRRSSASAAAAEAILWEYDVVGGVDGVDFGSAFAFGRCGGRFADCASGLIIPGRSALRKGLG
jgi:hypothetical protein